MVRTIKNKKRYFYAFFLTMVVFALGLVLGLTLENQKAASISKELQLQEIELNSLQLQYLFLEEVESENQCSIVMTTIEDNLKKLSKLIDKLDAYEEDGAFSKDQQEFVLLKREYTLSNIRYWMLSQKSQEACKPDNVNVVYFYSDDCADCDTQGYVLSDLKGRLNEKILVYPIDVSIEEPVVSMVLEEYNITEYPSLIIEDKVYHGYLSKKEILEEICPLYEEELEVCENV